MPQVKVRLPFHMERFFSKLAHRDLDHVEIETGTDVNTLVAQLGMDRGEIGLILVNGQLAKFETLLNDGDTVEIYILFAGG